MLAWLPADINNKNAIGLGELDVVCETRTKQAGAKERTAVENKVTAPDSVWARGWCGPGLVLICSRGDVIWGELV